MSANVRLFDIQLVCNDIDKKRYACGSCGKLAADPKGLRCDEKYHEQTPSLYCNKCAILIQNENKCPVNKHSNPVFSDEKLLKAQIEKNIQFICPYSLITQNDNIEAAFVCDTMEGNNFDEKKQQNDLCDWKGTYVALRNHVKRCKYKPKEEIISKIDEINKKMQRFENMQKEDAVKKDKQIEQLQCDNDILSAKIEDIMNRDKKMDKLKKEMDGLRGQINRLEQRVGGNTKPSMNMTVFMSTICFVILAVIGWIVYSDHNNIILLQQTTCEIGDSSNISYDHDQHILQTMKIRIDDIVNHIDRINVSVNNWNVTIKPYIDSVLDIEIKMNDFVINWTEEITVLHSEIESVKSWIENGTPTKIPKSNDPIVEWTKFKPLFSWIYNDNDKVKVNGNWMLGLYYFIKLILQCLHSFGIFILSVEAHSDYSTVAWIAGSHLLIQILYFCPMNLIGWIVMFMVNALSIGAARFIAHDSKIKYPEEGHIAAFFCELVVLYWRFWCGDDNSVIVVTFIVSAVVIFINFLGKGRHWEQMAMHAIIIAVISILYVILF